LLLGSTTYMYQTSLLKLIKSEPLARAALAVPALGTLLGSILMALGGFLPCLIMDLAGLVVGVLLLMAVVTKYLWIEHLLEEGDETQGRVVDLKDHPGLAIAQTTELEYEYSYDGVDYKARVVVHLPENELLGDCTTVIVDRDRPEHSFLKELYCVPCR
jgi:hypothetical protein